MLRLTPEEIMTHITDSLIISDENAVMIYVNEETAEQMGLPIEEIIGSSVYELLERGVYENSLILQAMQRRQTVSGISVTYRGQNLYSTSRPVFGADGGLELVVTTTVSEELAVHFNEQLAEKKRQIETYRQSIAYISSQRKRFIVGDPAMRDIERRLLQVAKMDSTVLLYGESGSGKEVLANFVHAESGRSEEPFIPVNCSAIPGELFESEFFGYERGAFTGANAKGHIGFFEMADKGTLFLDEIAELPKFMQSKLLRVVESGEVRRVGGAQVIHTDVRIIAATNRDLEKMVAENQFREDLFYRLNVLPIYVPPLRSRPGDILLIATDYLCQINRRYKTNKRFTDSAKQILLKYQWPGNVRELRNIVERAVILSTSDFIDNELEYLINIRPDAKMGDVKAPGAEAAGTLRDAMQLFEKEYIARVLAEHAGNIKQSAEALGIHRTSLHRKMRELGVGEPRVGVALSE